LSDKVDPKADPICKQLLENEINICIVTKSDQRLANVITKKYLNRKNANNNIDEATYLNMTLEDKIASNSNEITKIKRF